MKSFLLPGTDGGVAIQFVATAIVAPIVLLLVGRKQRDLAWLAGGVVALWIAFIAYRALH